MLDEDARPAVLQSCHPRGDSRFSLQTRRGGLVKIYDSVLMSGVSTIDSSVLLNIMFHAPMGRFHLELIYYLLFCLFFQQMLDGTTVEK